MRQISRVDTAYVLRMYQKDTTPLSFTIEEVMKKYVTTAALVSYAPTIDAYCNPTESDGRARTNGTGKEIKRCH